MNNTPHTPGPWELKYEKTGRTIDAVIKMGKAAIYFTRGIGQTFEEQQANARLIASAPDLLSALEEMISVFQDHEQYDEESAEVILSARAALRKAKGEA